MTRHNETVVEARSAALAHPGQLGHRPLSQKVAIESLFMSLMLVAAIWALFTFAGDDTAFSSDDHFFTYGINSETDPIQKPAPVFRMSFGTASGTEVTLFSDTNYSISAKVQGVKAYDDAMGEVVPYDLLLAWGLLADDDVDDNMTWEQSNRRGTVSGSLNDAGREIDSGYVITHVSNSHVIPANQSIASALDTIKPGDIVRIDGRLVDIKMVDDSKVYTVTSSKSRTDQGDGACEIIYVERIKINDQSWS
ncbi:MAG: hypothetical protein ACYC5A_00530 [Thermoleophilia bacterium]